MLDAGGICLECGQDVLAGGADGEGEAKEEEDDDASGDGEGQQGGGGAAGGEGVPDQTGQDWARSAKPR